MATPRARTHRAHARERAAASLPTALATTLPCLGRAAYSSITGQVLAAIRWSPEHWPSLTTGGSHILEKRCGRFCRPAHYPPGVLGLDGTGALEGGSNGGAHLLTRAAPERASSLGDLRRNLR